MTHFIVSARKYRPTSFNDVVGQSHITQTLKNAIKNNQLAQAFLFTGPRGVGKTTCARILAKTINCYNITEEIEPCNKCESCLSFNQNASFNIHELDAASNNSVDDIRLLIEKVHFAPQIGKYNIYIIDEVHMLSNQAFNAFLKTLEEPPDYAKFILATTEKHKIIPTILSRCQIYDFRRIKVEDIVQHLQKIASYEGIEVEEEALRIIAIKADGGLRDALSIFDQLIAYTGKKLTYQGVTESLNILSLDYHFKITDNIITGNYIESFKLLNEIILKGYEPQQIITGLGEHFRNLLVAKNPENINLIDETEYFKNLYITQASKCEYNFLLNALKIFYQFDVSYATAKNKKLHAELMLIQLAEIFINSSLPTNNLNANNNKTHISSSSNSNNQISTKKTTQETKEISQKTIITEKNTTINENKAQLGIPKTQATEENTKPHALTSTPSITSVLKNISQKDKEKDTKIIKRDNKFTHEQLIAAWLKYAEKLKDTNTFLYTYFINNVPELSENTININVKNDVLKTNFEAVLTDMNTFFKEELQNDFINIRCNCIEDNNDKEAKPVNAKDKFKYLLKKNPLLEQFKNELDLEFDY